MPPLDNPDENEVPGQTLAVTAETLFLVNLLLVPGIAFIVLVIMYFKTIQTAPALARCHMRQAINGSIWAGVFLVIINIIILLTGGYQEASTWALLITYFTTAHATLVLLGMLGLSRAMAGKFYTYPLIGRYCKDQGAD